MKKLSLFLLALCLIFQVEAILPPLYETSSVIQQILRDDQLGKTLQSGEVIEKIEKNSAGYLITTNKSRVQVRVEVLPAQNMGPAQFKISFGHPESIS